jgi:hypothetical protein
MKPLGLNLNLLLEKLRYYYHDVNQPLTSILLLAEIGTSQDGLDQRETQELYEAGLQCREVLAELHKFLDKWQAEAELSDSEVTLVESGSYHRELIG